MRDRVRRHPVMTVYLLVGAIILGTLYAAPDGDANIGLGMLLGIWWLPGLVWCLARLQRNLHPPRD